MALGASDLHNVQLLRHSVPQRLPASAPLLGASGYTAAASTAAAAAAAVTGAAAAAGLDQQGAEAAADGGHVLLSPDLNLVVCQRQGAWLVWPAAASVQEHMCTSVVTVEVTCVLRNAVVHPKPAAGGLQLGCNCWCM